jgi:hypothetical protein
MCGCIAARAEGGRGPCGEVCAKGDVFGPAGWKAISGVEKILRLANLVLSNCFTTQIFRPIAWYRILSNK